MIATGRYDFAEVNYSALLEAISAAGTLSSAKLAALPRDKDDFLEWVMEWSDICLFFSPELGSSLTSFESLDTNLGRNVCSKFPGVVMGRRGKAS